MADDRGQKTIADCGFRSEEIGDWSQEAEGRRQIPAGSGQPAAVSGKRCTVDIARKGSGED